MKVYRDGTSALNMSLDGWSRGFDKQQTLDEMREMGVEITEEQLSLHWKRIDDGVPKC